MTSLRKLEISAVTAGDYPALARFLSSTEEPARGGDFWKARLKFWWDKNPAFSEDLERGWALRRDEEMLGFIGRIPTFFQWRGKPKTVFNVTTWRVLPAYRNQSMKLLFQFLKASENSLLFDTTPDKTVAQILERSGFQPLPSADHRVSFAVLNPEKFLGKFLSFPFGIFQNFRLKKLKSLSGKVLRPEKADASFDGLWRETEGRYPNTNVRTSEILNWYCLGNPNSKKELFACYQNEKLQGYAIGAGRAAKNFREFECVDLWTGLSEKETVVQSLADSLFRYAKENSFDLVIFPHFTPELAGIFQRCGLFQKAAGRRNRYFKIGSKEKIEFKPGDSYFVSLQGDYGL